MLKEKDDQPLAVIHERNIFFENCKERLKARANLSSALEKRSKQRGRRKRCTAMRMYQSAQFNSALAAEGRRGGEGRLAKERQRHNKTGTERSRK